MTALPNAVRWVVVLLHDHVRKAIINGHKTEAWKLSCSVFQGCPLAPMLYAVACEFEGRLHAGHRPRRRARARTAAAARRWSWASSWPWPGSPWPKWNPGYSNRPAATNVTSKAQEDGHPDGLPERCPRPAQPDFSKARSATHVVTVLSPVRIRQVARLY